MNGQLDEFCQLIRSEYGSPAGIAPGDLAKVFVSHSGLSSDPSFVEIHSVLRRYGVGEITAADLSAGKLKGHHFSYKGQEYTVQYEKDLWIGSIELAMMHELYEIIAERSQRWCPDYRALPIPQICWQANTFAAAALMQAEVLLKALFETGFDVVQLHHRFLKAYSSVAIRAVQVLKDHPGNSTQVLIAVYERNEPERDTSLWGNCCREKFQAKYVVKTPGIKISRRGRRIKAPGYSSHLLPYHRHLLPQKGGKVAPGGLVDNIINGAGPLYIERVWGFDLWGSNDLACLAVPVVWHLKQSKGTVLGKVILIVMPYEQATMLDPQLQKLSPYVIPERFQFI